MSMVYLDYAAATPLAPEVLEAMKPFLTDRFGNPGSSHRAGRAQYAALEDARKRVAMALGAKPTEIIFTSGSTEAANLAIQGVLRQNPGSSAVTTGIEHKAVLASLQAFETEGHPLRTLRVGESGVVDPQDLADCVDDQTVLVCLQYANNEIGTIQPVATAARKLSDLRAERSARGIKLPLYVYSDAAQAGLLNLQVSRLGIDLMSMGGSKIYGPVGSGFLYVRTGVKLHPVVFGGGQESGLRSGTENVAAAVGLATALALMQHNRTAEARRQQLIRDELWHQLAKLDGVQLNGAMKPRLSGNLNLSINGVNADTLVTYMDKAGFALATGSACTNSSEGPSHVLLEIGRTIAQADSSLRISIGRMTTSSEAKKTALALIKTIQHLRTMAP